jgi:sortase A
LRIYTGRLLIVIGLVLVAWAGLTLAHATSVWNEFGAHPPAIADIRSEPGTPLKAGTALGVVEIPRLGLAAVILEGEDESTLLKGVGHVSETPLPWEESNSVLAGHRDTFFRDLRHAKKGDLVRVVTGDRTIDYVVREVDVVDPTDVEVLEPTERPTLTLITCYPFRYIGPAPQRYVVRAERTSDL